MITIVTVFYFPAHYVEYTSIRVVIYYVCYSLDVFLDVQVNNDSVERPINTSVSQTLHTCKL
jgi:hypothetical protein